MWASKVSRTYQVDLGPTQASQSVGWVWHGKVRVDLPGWDGTQDMYLGPSLEVGISLLRTHQTEPERICTTQDRSRDWGR